MQLKYLSVSMLKKLKLLLIIALFSFRDVKPFLFVVKYLPSRHDLRFDEEADPAGDHEHEAGQVDLDQELHLLPLQPHLYPTGGVGPAGQLHLGEPRGKILDTLEVLQRSLALLIVDVVGGAGHCLMGVVV